MSDNPHQPNPHQGDDELLQEEENEQEKVEDISDQDVAQMGAMVQGIGGFMMLKNGRHNEFKNAYNTLTDAKLAENLLDLDHPEKLGTVQSAVKVSRHELAKTGNKARGYTESRFLFWKSNRLTADQLYRAGYSTMLAKQLHHRVDQTSGKYKIESFVNNFKGTDQENEARLKSLNKWRKEHPDKSLDEAILAESKRIKESRGEKFSKIEEKKVQEQLAAARSKAVEDHKAEATRTSDKIKYTLDPNNPAPAAAQFGRDLKEIQTGQIAPEKLAGGFAEIPSDLGDAIMGYDLPAKKAPTPAPTSTPTPVPPKLNLFSKLSAKLSNFKDKIFGNIRANWGRMVAGFKNSFVGKFFGKLSGFNPGSLIKKGIKSLAVKAGLGAATGGVATALDTINDVIKALTGFDLGQTLAWGALLLIIGIPLLAILFVMNNGSSANTIPKYGVGNSMKLHVLNPNRKMAWSDFENNFLVLKKKKLQTTSLTWEEFEKNNLRRSLPLLSEKK